LFRQNQGYSPVLPHDAIAKSPSHEHRTVIHRRFVQNATVDRIALAPGASEQHIDSLTRRAAHLLKAQPAAMEDRSH
jgi:hypothetical protein